VAIALVMLLGGFTAQALRPGPALAASERLPNLRMLPLRDWRIQNMDGRRLLRFTTIMGNEGPGAFEVRGYRSSRSQTKMKIDQVIYDSAGDSRRVRTGADGSYAGDGHDHWHVQRIMTYELYKVANPATVRGGAKTGFCFLDTTAWRLDLPYARQFPYYQESWCGTRSTLTNRVGISVGWGDRYPWNFAYQWIDITGLPAGHYIVRATVDIADWYEETAEYDGCRWARVSIPKSGTRVEVLDSGTGCGHAAMDPANRFAGTHAYDPPRGIAFEAGAYTGYTFNELGTELRSKWRRLSSPSEATAVARSRIPGRPGYWFLVGSGAWEGFWIRDTSRVARVD
jgi:hypothetical protein